MKSDSTVLNGHGDQSVSDAAPEASVTVPKKARAAVTRVPNEGSSGVIGGGRITIQASTRVIGGGRITIQASSGVIGPSVVPCYVTACDGPVVEGAPVNEKGQIVVGPKVPNGSKP